MDKFIKRLFIVVVLIFILLICLGVIYFYW